MKVDKNDPVKQRELEWETEDAIKALAKLLRDSMALPDPRQDPKAALKYVRQLSTEDLYAMWSAIGIVKITEPMIEAMLLSRSDRDAVVTRNDQEYEERRARWRKEMEDVGNVVA